MPQAASADGVELLELRVLDGPNRFFTRPAIKLEFGADEPGVAAEVATAAGQTVRHLYAALDLSPPRLTMRDSADRQRAAIAFLWHRRAIAQAVGTAASRVALGITTERRELRALRAIAPGPRPHLPTPHVPVVAITGTNGKSTTTRLIAHIAREAGRRVGMTNSDGIYVRDELVEPGDWTGFGGAGRVLAEPGLQLAVLETARGGILLRGIGYAANDVAVVTNVSADHLGLQGIDTLDELAEVKATVVRITRRGGWAVLNADDPRVWAMRRETRAGWYAFSLEADSPRVREALERGGRAAVLRDGVVTLLRGRRARTIAPVAELPVTFGGLSTYNVANALAAAAACDALGFSASRIATGLRSFTLDTGANPGRLNLYERRGTLVLIDFAHNEAGLQGLLDVSRQLVTRPGGGRSRGKVRLALGTAGDRTDEILRNLGQLAGAGADDVVICEKRHYLRGRDLAAMNRILRAGVQEGGFSGKVEAHPSELAALQALEQRAKKGDVVAVMTHVERSEIADWLDSAGYRPVPFSRLRELVAG
ncbi:MAG TPA: Mur ligase family protein [Candidatus Limnocylindria bacterium]|nr:Mur ligase family protein [Candidatus Limnocylindria bacterium]